MTNPFETHAAATATAAPQQQFAPQQQPAPSANGMGAASPFAPSANGSAQQQAPAFAPQAPAAPQQQPQAPSGGAPSGLGFDPDEGQDPFSAPNGQNMERIADHVGELLLIRPTGFESNKPTVNGPRDAVFANVATLDRQGGEAGKIYYSMQIFQAPLVRELNATLQGGKPFLLGRLSRGNPRNGDVTKAPYIFATPTAEDAALARQFLAHLKTTGQTL